MNDVAGKNGVVVRKRHTEDGAGFRTYEVHQRERVGESTEKIKPQMLIDEDYRQNPYPALTILREHYPFYRDWLNNSYWVTRYNDVTSIFTDDANFETRSKLWHMGVPEFGRDLGEELALITVEAERIEAHATQVIEATLTDLGDSKDLATGFAGNLALKLLAAVLGIETDQEDAFNRLYWRMQRGTSWQPLLQEDGVKALAEMAEFLAPHLAARAGGGTDDYLSVLAGLGASANDAATTLLERDHETLHGALSNLWCLLLTHEGEFAQAVSDTRLMKLAYLETLRHSPPVLNAYRFARHEVERFGKLIPTGARLVCSAAAANRDGTIFDDPERFIVDRRDLCQREPRGQYRADGLASGIAFGLGKPSIHPAIPEDRPRSRYAITRDLAVQASMALVTTFPKLALQKGASPTLSSLSVGEMHTCWQLPVSLG